MPASDAFNHFIGQVADGITKAIDNMLYIMSAHDGGEGSGNFNHEGRPGQVGGSGEGGGATENSAEKTESLNKKVAAGLEKGYPHSYNIFASALNEAPVGSEVTFTGEDGDQYIAIKTGENTWEWDGEKTTSEDVAGYTDYSKASPPPLFKGRETKPKKTYSGRMAETHRAIDAAGTTSEVSQVLRDASIYSSSARCNLTGAKAESAKEVAHAATSMTEEYPWMKKRITRVRTDNLGPDADGAYSFYRGDITLDRRTLQGNGNPTVKKPGEFHPIGTGSHASNYQHEFGHAVVYTVAKKRGENPDSFAERVRSSALKKAGIQDSNRVVRFALSGYANENAHEFIAESFSEYHSSPSPRPLCRAVVEEVKKEAKEAGFK